MSELNRDVSELNRPLLELNRGRVEFVFCRVELPFPKKINPIKKYENIRILIRTYPNFDSITPRLIYLYLILVGEYLLLSFWTQYRSLDVIYGPDLAVCVIYMARLH